MSEERKSFTPRSGATRSTATKRTTVASPRPAARKSFNIQTNEKPAGRPSFSRGPARGGKKPFGKKPVRRLSKQQQIALQAKKAKLERIEQSYQVLHAAYPKAFDYENIKPLPVDFHKELFETVVGEGEGKLRKSVLREFLASYVRNERYHRAVLDIKQRFTLQGELSTPFTEDELKYHQECLEKEEKTKQAKKRPSFAKKPGGFKKPNFNRSNARPTLNRPFQPNLRRNTVKPAFTVGQRVAANDKKGTVKEVIGDKVRVSLDGGLTLLFNLSQLKAE